jgi:ribokinase
VRAAVVGHVEWIEFVTVDHVPAPGEIVAAEASWEQAGGGGGVAAIQLAQLADSVVFFTVLGDDERGRRAEAELRARGVEVHASFVDAPQRKAFTHVDAARERTITTIGPRLGPQGDDRSLPWNELAHCDAVYFCAGDLDALRAARRARVLVVSARELRLLATARVDVDVLVGSGNDAAERYRAGELDPPPRIVVMTDGPRGGDCFAAGLAFALGAGLDRTEALAFAARCGAGALAGRGVHAERVALR